MLNKCICKTINIQIDPHTFIFALKVLCHKLFPFRLAVTPDPNPTWVSSNLVDCKRLIDDVNATVVTTELKTKIK